MAEEAALDPAVEQEDHERPEPIKAEGETPLDRLRRRRREMENERPPLKLEIPGYEGLLRAVYRALQWDELKAIGTKFAGSHAHRLELLVHSETLVQACQGFELRDGDRWVALETTAPDLEGGPVNYADKRLAVAVGVEDKIGKGKPRDILRAVFKDDVLVSDHHDDYTNWRRKAIRGGDEDFTPGS